MELYQLRYFLEVARQRNFTRAAARLNLAQPALSEQIRNLEEELGAVLFERGRRESTLTAAGESLRSHAELLIEQAESARRSVQELVGLKRGRLVIGAIPSVSAGLLPAAVAKFRSAHPQVELVLREGTSEAVAEWVDSGRVELGFVQLPSREGHFTEQLLCTEAFVLLVAADHAVARRKFVDLASLDQEPFVFYKGRARESALAACESAGIAPRVACESGELETVHALVAAGLGVAILPELAARRAAPECAMVRIRRPHIERSLGLLSRRGAPLSPAAAAFHGLLG